MSIVKLVVVGGVVLALGVGGLMAQRGMDLPPGDNDPGVAGNERLTALAGAVLLALIALEVVTLPGIHALLSLHVFVGVLLAGPLAVKTASTGWRFVRYYVRQPAYRHKGPPHPVLRALAPLLLVMTLVVIGSGIALVTTGPGDQGVLDRVHKASFLVWAVLIGVHVLAYIRRVPGLIASDWRPTVRPHAPGRVPRLALNIAALIAGAIAALLILHGAHSFPSGPA